MSKFLKIPTKAIPMELDSSFTPVELIGKLTLKINEIILGFNNLNKKIDDLDIDNLNQRIDNLNNKIDVEIADLREHINLEAERVLLEAKQYTDQRINEILNYKTISARDYDNLGMTAQTYDSMNITAYRYDTESAQILIIN